MFQILKNYNSENLLNRQIYKLDDIYGILLKTGKFMNAIDVIHQRMITFFFFNIIEDKLR